jgi:hypothetical protein
VSDIKRYQHYERTFAIMAQFDDTEQGMKDANAFMMANPLASVLAVTPLGQIILVNVDDAGEPA